MKARIGKSIIDLDIEQRVGGGVVGTRYSAQGPACVRSREVAGVQAGSNPAPSLYKSKWEIRYAQVLDLEKQAGRITGWIYEPFSFRLGDGKRFKVDFVTWGPMGTEAIEVKGWSKNRRDGMTHLAWAAQRFPFFTWRLVWWTGNGFDGRYVSGD